jgi:hypothetical protein
VSHRVRSVEHVPRVRRQVTPPPVTAEAEAVDEEPASYTASWGRPTPADAAAMRGVPIIGPGGGAIRGTQPGKNLR